jgi:hypothetical protein
MLIPIGGVALDGEPALGGELVGERVEAAGRAVDDDGGEAEIFDGSAYGVLVGEVTRAGEEGALVGHF